MVRRILTGQQFSRLLVLGFADRLNGKVRWHCLCDCGEVVTVSASNLTTGHTNSCGCWMRERVSATHNKERKHGLYRHEYLSWLSMKSRCSNPNNTDYKNYGARGIVVCPQWEDFDVFLTDMGMKPSRKYTIERRNNDGNYEPTNCYWATRAEQNNNTRQNHWLTYEGRQMTIRQITRQKGVSNSFINNRLRSGWCLDCTVMQPKRGTCVHRTEV